VVVTVSGRQVRTRYVSNTGLQLIVKPGSDPFTVFVSSPASFDKNKDLVAEASDHLSSATMKGFESLRDSNGKWWSSFWEKSYVNLHSYDGEAEFITGNYNYFMYVMASSSRGSFPPKFNGMIWTTGGDARKWGNNYWGANQSCMYNGLFPANRPELI
jgi:hypothetical protein